MNIMGENKMELQQVIDQCKEVPRREDISNKKVVNEIWRPISHSHFAEAMAVAIEQNDLEIISSDFALNKSGHLLVGGFKVKGERLPTLPNNLNGEFELFVRHANDMSRGMQVNAGLNLMVCTNGCMSGETIARHKHTKHFNLESWANDQALPEFIADCYNQVEHVDRLRGIDCSDDLARYCIMEAAAQEIIPTSAIKPIYNEWKNPVFSTEDFPLNTGWKLYNDFTHVAQKSSPDRQLTIVQESGRLIQELCV